MTGFSARRPKRPTGFPPKVKRLIAERASTTGDAADAYCEIWQVCNGARSGPAHHRRPRRSGGDRRSETNGAANGCAPCPRCHEWIESNRTVAKANGWLLEANQVPAEERWLRRGQWVLTDDDGGVSPVEGVERCAS